MHSSAPGAAARTTVRNRSSAARCSAVRCTRYASIVAGFDFTNSALPRAVEDGLDVDDRRAVDRLEFGHREFERRLDGKDAHTMYADWVRPVRRSRAAYAAERRGEIVARMDS